jgi:hypothetical protein
MKTRPHSRKKKRARERARVIELSLRGTWPRLEAPRGAWYGQGTHSQINAPIVSDDGSRWLWETS